jgi:hypothetical protein
LKIALTGCAKWRPIPVFCAPGGQIGAVAGEECVVAQPARRDEGFTEERKHDVAAAAHLGIMTALSLLAMFVLMTAMVDRFANVYPNVNQFYMAGLMAAPMAIIELLVMRGMYPDLRINLVFGGVAIVAFVLFFLGIRAQTAVGDVQFIKSMIPHHAGAILMCDRAPISDAELRKLCGEIAKGQQQEIEQMKRILARLSD